MNNAFPSIIAAVAVVSVWLGWLTGERQGRRTGRAEGWLERYDEEINEETKRIRRLNARRGNDGKFTEVKK